MQAATPTTRECGLHITATFQGFPPSSIWDLCERYGWRCAARLRLPTADAYFADGRIALAVETGGKMYHLAFDATGDLNPFITAVTNISQMWPSYPIGIDYASTASYSNYHTFEMRYSPVSQDASVLIDGETVISNYPGNPFGITNRIVWGAGGDSAHALAYWLSVSFSMEVPRPSIADVQAQGGTGHAVNITWQSQSNLLYRVEWTPSLRPPDWDQIFARLAAGSVSIEPNGNLISNLGCRPDATHTVIHEHPFAELPLKDGAYPLRHPRASLPDDEADLVRAKGEFLVSSNPLRNVCAKLSNPYFCGHALRRVPILGHLWASYRDKRDA